MATIVDLPYELLYRILFLLVQSSVGAADFARIISVCRKFLLFAEDEHILKLVNFDIKMEFKNLYKYQHVNSVIVKCSEAGNVPARLLLGKAMATIADVPSELLFRIIFMLVQSSAGAAYLARIISVCRRFLLYTEDVCILKGVNFDIKLDLKKCCHYQHVHGLLVKCSEAGNISAQFLLGKVMLLSSSQLFLSEWQKAECDVHPCDLATLSDLCCILATNVPVQNCKADSFITYFLPKEVSNGESSQTRLVHHQLVKLFLLNGSYHDFIEMDVFLRSYIKYFTSVTEEDSPLLDSINALLLHAAAVRSFKKLLMEAKRCFIGCEDRLSAVSNHFDATYCGITECRSQALRLFELNFG